ncbi:protein DJ-1 homolog B-like isoform X2 [Arachis stenosperma]|uniref:protein DJ-1 homolog B-like isoform X2 n=1 Tax=Arachis stenosperma TaxID=217475 RepID=UPI0025ACE880|nr:protein DJ-1 homolog B-like isoform X2 [Arachis stenosperma]
MALRHLRVLPHPLTNFTPKLSPNRPKHRVCFSLSASQIMASISRKVLVPIADGTEPMEAVITVDVLRRSGADVTVASAGNQLTVQALHGVKIVADAVVSDVVDTTFDLVALPGGVPGVDHLRECGVLEKLVKKHVEDGRLYAAVCAAPAAVLGPWGLLKGVKVMRSSHGDEYVFAELNPVQWTTENPPKVLVPIANGSEEMEAVIIIDILRRAKANVVVASLEDKLEIVASRNVKLEADMLLDEAAKLSYDLIVLPGGLGGAQTFAKSETLVSLLKKQRENRYYGAICASPALVLEPHGLLKGKKATAFPALCNKLSDPSEAENRVVVDGNLVTSRGPGTSIEFALAIVEKLFGRKLGLELAKTIVFTSP